MKMKITILLLLLPLTNLAQVDTTKLKSEIKTLSLAASAVAHHYEINSLDAVPTINLLNQLIRTDMAILMEERRKKNVKGK